MKLSIDLDSTLCNFCEAWNKWLYVYGYTDKVIEMSEVISYSYHKDKFGEPCKDFFLKNPSDCYTNWIEPYKNANTFVQWCKDNIEDVEILTHANSPETEKAKLEFCEKHFNFTNLNFIDILHDKYLLLEDRVLVDDYPYHIIKNILHNKNHSIIYDHDGLNGWSKLPKYTDLFRKEDVSNFEYDKLWITINYTNTQFILERLINHGI